MLKLKVDAGHGGKDSGALYGKLYEKDLTLKIAKYLGSYLQKVYQGVEVSYTRTTDKFLELSEIVASAEKSKADLLYSIHINSGGGTGYESYISDKLTATSKTSKLRTKIHNEFIKQTKLTDRGKKSAPFYILVNTSMSAILTENLFIDTTSDRKKLQDEKFLVKIGEAHAEAIAKAYNLKKKPKQEVVVDKGAKGDETFYRVIAGSFKNKQYAINRQKELKRHKIETFLAYEKVGGTGYYRVVAGSYKNRKNANVMVTKLKKKNYSSFLTVFNG